TTVAHRHGLELARAHPVAPASTERLGLVHRLRAEPGQRRHLPPPDYALVRFQAQPESRALRPEPVRRAHRGTQGQVVTAESKPIGHVAATLPHRAATAISERGLERTRRTARGWFSPEGGRPEKSICAAGITA